MNKLLLTLATCLLLTIFSNPVESNEMVEYELTSDLRSFLFSKCISDANSIKGIVHSVHGESSAYTRMYADASIIGWDAAENTDSMLACSDIAFEREAAAFIYTSDGSCRTTSDDDHEKYDATTTEGDVIYANLVAARFRCAKPDGVLEVGEEDTTLFCGLTCTEEGLIESISYYEPATSEPKTCCDTDTSPCLYIASTGQVDTCEAIKICAGYHLRLVQVETPESMAAVTQFVKANANVEGEMFWVNVRYDNGAWYHVPSMIKVDDNLWVNVPPSSPTADKCVAMDTRGKLDEQPCGSSGNNLRFACEDFGYSGQELEACAVGP